MKKIFLILSLCIIMLNFSSAEYYVNIYADSTTASSSGNVVLTNMGSYYKVSATNGTYEVDRALVIEWLFYSPQYAKNFTNVKKVVSEDTRDINKSGFYKSVAVTEANNNGYLDLDLVFTTTSNNNNVSSWSYVTGTDTQWEIPSTSAKNTGGDEIGTDTSSDQINNPATAQEHLSCDTGQSDSIYAIILSNSNITHSVNDVGGNSEVVESINFLDEYDFPRFTLPPSITLNSPEDDHMDVIYGDILFNITSTSNNLNSLSYILLYINNTFSELKYLTGIEDTEIFTKSFTTIGEYNWSVKVCDNQTVCATSETRDFQISNYKVNSISIESEAYETEYQTYSINITPYQDSLLTSVKLVLNGTEYSATKSGTVWSKSLDVPSSMLGTQTPYFKITYDGSNYNSTTTSQTILPIQFGLCNATLTVPYINLTFIDESTSGEIDAAIQSSTWEYYLGSGSETKEYTFLNASENPSYAFCTLPANKTYYTDVSLIYLASTYPLRTWSPSTLSLTNSTTNQSLYLLSQDDGIYSTFLTVTSLNTVIIGANIEITRESGGTNVTVAQGTTDSAGSVTFWLNPNYDHFVTASKTGYGSTSVTVKPTQSTYTLTLDSATNYSYISNVNGLLWGFFPKVGIINQSVSNNYGFNISSIYNNIVGCRIELLNKDKTVTLATETYNTTNGTFCSVSVAYTVNNTYPQIKGRLLIDIGNGYQILEEDAYWILITTDTTGMTFSDWFTNMKEFDLRYFAGETDEIKQQHREYTQILIFFLITMIICAVLNTAGWDIQTNGGMIFLVGFLIIAASFSGFLTLASISPFALIDKYFIAIVYSMFMIGFAARSMQ